MKHQLIFGFIYLLSLSLFLQAEDKVTAVWIVRHQMTSKESIDKVLALSAKMGITDLFVQIRGRGDAYYESEIVPKGENVAVDFDPLQYLLSQRQGKKIRIHGWVNVFLVWSGDSIPKSPKHIYNTHPEWLVYSIATPKNSEQNEDRLNYKNSEGYYLSPLLPEVQEHLLKVFQEIVKRYPLDGIHFDYIRFPGEGFEFDDVVREKFKLKYIIDPYHVRMDPSGFTENYGHIGYDIFYTRWGNFLRNGLTNFVSNIATEIKFLRPDIIISAAVKPDLFKAHWTYYQEWDLWVNNGWLDWAVPMNYTPDTQMFIQRVTKIENKVARLEKVVMGIALYNQNPYSVKQKLSYLLKETTINKFKGFSLFSYDQLAASRQLQEYLQQALNRRSNK